MQFNMFKIQFKDYLHSSFHCPSLKSIFDPNLYLHVHVHLFHLYQRIRQFEFKKNDLFPCQRLQTQGVEKTQRDCNMKGQFKSCLMTSQHVKQVMDFINYNRSTTVLANLNVCWRTSVQIGRWLPIFRMSVKVCSNKPL